MPTYSFNDQLSRGEAAERQLDAHFADRFQIAEATHEQQRLGIDRIFVHRAMGKAYTIEYKTDWTAGRTNNAFIETVSVDTMSIPGWVYTSEAQWLIYFVPPKETIYIIRFRHIQAKVPEWVEQYGPEKIIPNDGYCTLGVVVPLDIFAQCASKIEKLT